MNRTVDARNARVARARNREYLASSAKVLFLALCLFWPVLAWGHQGNTCYLTLVVDSNQLSGQWEIPLNDLNAALNLDSNKDHSVSLEELANRFSDVATYSFERLQLRFDGNPALIVRTETAPSIQVFPDGSSTTLHFACTNLTNPKALEVEYRFMFDKKPLDQAFLQLDCKGTTQTAVFAADQTVQRFDLEAPQHGATMLSFAWHGVWHILLGFDHILFLLALLFPAVLRREAGGWSPVEEFRSAFWNVFKIATAFTVAHSLTLTLAALKVVTLPPRFVEPVIAASVAVAALNNLRPFIRGPVWVVAFGFGLIHGFGFAGVLAELDLPRNVLVSALVSFNVGVEAGQLAVVAVFLPLAYLARHAPLYRGLVLQTGSALIALLAALWFVERVFDWKLLSS